MTGVSIFGYVRDLILNAKQIESGFCIDELVLKDNHVNPGKPMVFNRF